MNNPKLSENTSADIAVKAVSPQIAPKIVPTPFLFIKIPPAFFLNYIITAKTVARFFKLFYYYKNEFLAKNITACYMRFNSLFYFCSLLVDFFAILLNLGCIIKFLDFV